MTGGECTPIARPAGRISISTMNASMRRPRSQPRPRPLPALRHHSLHLDLLRDRAAHGEVQGIRFPRGDLARGQRHHPEVGPRRRLPRGQRGRGAAPARDDPGRPHRDRLRARGRPHSHRLPRPRRSGGAEVTRLCLDVPPTSRTCPPAKFISFRWTRTANSR